MGPFWGHHGTRYFSKNTCLSKGTFFSSPISAKFELSNCVDQYCSRQQSGHLNITCTPNYLITNWRNTYLAHYQLGTSKPSFDQSTISFAGNNYLEVASLPTSYLYYTICPKFHLTNLPIGVIQWKSPKVLCQTNRFFPIFYKNKRTFSITFNISLRIRKNLRPYTDGRRDFIWVVPDDLVFFKISLTLSALVVSTDIPAKTSL